ncbi:division abnormally delayed protein [Orussus abietinus]|uniref:division abnormally delayed protein n=1 Tax=Orussus abietinus TaxID=222816 RepID=UPI000624FB35|nr:division abnormally delayed protein [Orussus abietinus]
MTGKLRVGARDRSAAALLVLAALLWPGRVGGLSPRSRRPEFAAGNDTLPIDCDRLGPVLQPDDLLQTPTQDQTPDLRRGADPAKSICGGPCCNRTVEEHFRHRAKEDFHNSIHHHSMSLRGLLVTTADALRETVTTLVRQSENKTLTLFDQVYRSMAVSSRPSIKALYQEMIDYVSPKNTPDDLLQAITRDMLQQRFTEFFTKLFPIAYHRAVNPHQQDFTDKFKTCLYETMDEIQPFGDIPEGILRSVGKSLEATRVLIQALTLGSTVLDKTDGVLFSGGSAQQEACYDALLRMTYCSRCLGTVPTDVRPCAGLCTNVMRGCLTGAASELDLTWSRYVETVERLVVAVDGRNDPLGLNAERAMRQLDVHISDAIMHAMETGPALEEKVRKACGRSELKPTVAATTPEAEGADRKPAAAHVPQPLSPPSGSHRLPTQLHLQLGNFLASVIRSRSFYATLADTICEDYRYGSCWNGEHIGEYTKTIVDFSPSAQRYNPEFTMVVSTSSTMAPYGNPNASKLIDKLRHIISVMQSQLISTPDSGALLADEGQDGSGSGMGSSRRGGDDFFSSGSVVDDDDEDDDYDRHRDRGNEYEASGSGMGPSTSDVTMETPPETNTTSAATTAAASTLLLILVGTAGSLGA